MVSLNSKNGKPSRKTKKRKGDGKSETPSRFYGVPLPGVKLEELSGTLFVLEGGYAVEEIGASVAELRARYLPALERLLPAARGAGVIDFAVTHEPRATFKAAPGTRRLRPGARTAVPGLYLAGAWTDTGWPATMESAVRSGLTAARAALENA